jgi:thymidine kinase
VKFRVLTYRVLAATIERMDVAPYSPPSTALGRSSDRPLGLIEIIGGCMFAGKTTALLGLLRRDPARVALVVKHDRDNRYSHCQIMTHDGDGCDAVCVSRARQICDHVTDATETVAIDEGHFYDAALADVCRELAAAGKRVIVATLDMDMWGRPFSTIERLKEFAGVVRVQHGVCARCGRPASRTYRKTPIVEGNLVGGAEDFEPRCAKCWSPPREQPIEP